MSEKNIRILVKVSSLLSLLLENNISNADVCSDIVTCMIKELTKEELKETIHTYFYGKIYCDNQIIKNDFPEEYKKLCDLFGIIVQTEN